MKANYQALIKTFPEIRRDEILSKHSTFNIGGQADLFFECKNIDILPDLIKETKKLKIPYFVLGGGSNVLFDSRGFRGLVIKIMDSSHSFEGEYLIAKPGARITLLAKESIKLNLSGLEWANGLPGTIGGAVYGNAGCHESDIAENFESAKLFSPEKGIFEVDKNYMDFKYRYSKLKESHEIVLEIKLKLSKKSADIVKSMESMNFRIEKQPSGFTNGSFFKNPANDSAGRLIDAAGLKGYKIGNAQISEKHANFFMNLGNASSDDILALRDLAKKEVKEKFGVELEEEVIIVPSVIPA